MKEKTTRYACCRRVIFMISLSIVKIRLCYRKRNQNELKTSVTKDHGEFLCRLAFLMILQATNIDYECLLYTDGRERMVQCQVVGCPGGAAEPVHERERMVQCQEEYRKRELSEETKFCVQQ